jgi:hypothetical protein
VEDRGPSWACTGAVQVLQEYSFVWSSKMDVKLLVKLLGKRSGGGAQSLLAKVVRLKASLPACLLLFSADPCAHALLTSVQV